MKTHVNEEGETLQYKIKGQTRPFIDNDLQLQIPGVESTSEKHNFQNYTQVYSHYSGALNPPLPLPINKQELEQAMQEAEKAYFSWKGVQEQLAEKIRSFPN